MLFESTCLPVIAIVECERIQRKILQVINLFAADFKFCFRYIKTGYRIHFVKRNNEFRNIQFCSGTYIKRAECGLPGNLTADLRFKTRLSIQNEQLRSF